MFFLTTKFRVVPRDERLEDVQVCLVPTPRENLKPFHNICTHITPCRCLGEEGELACLCLVSALVIHPVLYCSVACFFFCFFCFFSFLFFSFLFFFILFYFILFYLLIFFCRPLIVPFWTCT